MTEFNEYQILIDKKLINCTLTFMDGSISVSTSQHSPMDRYQINYVWFKDIIYSFTELTIGRIFKRTVNCISFKSDTESFILYNKRQDYSSIVSFIEDGKRNDQKRIDDVQDLERKNEEKFTTCKEALSDFLDNPYRRMRCSVLTSQIEIYKKNIHNLNNHPYGFCITKEWDYVGIETEQISDSELIESIQLQDKTTLESVMLRFYWYETPKYLRDWNNQALPDEETIRNDYDSFVAGFFSMLMKGSFEDERELMSLINNLGCILHLSDDEFAKVCLSRGIDRDLLSDSLLSQKELVCHYLDNLLAIAYNNAMVVAKVLSFCKKLDANSEKRLRNKIYDRCIHEGNKLLDSEDEKAAEIIMPRLFQVIKILEENDNKELQKEYAYNLLEIIFNNESSDSNARIKQIIYDQTDIDVKRCLREMYGDLSFTTSIDDYTKTEVMRYASVYSDEEDYDHAYPFLKYLADLGNSEYMRQVALLNSEEKIIDYDYNTAGKYFCKAIEAGDLESCGHYAKLLADHFPQTAEVVIKKLYEQAIGTGDYNVIYNYGRFLKSRHFTTFKEKMEAFQYIKKAANNGVLQAEELIQLSFTKNEYLFLEDYTDNLFEVYMFAEDLYLKKRYEEAYFYYSYLCDKAPSTADYAFKLGLFYDRGYYVERDINKARQFYETAAEHNHGIAANNLAVLLENEFTGISEDRIASLYELAINKNNMMACYNYALLLRRTHFKTYQEKLRVYNYLQKAASFGISSAIDVLNSSFMDFKPKEDIGTIYFEDIVIVSYSYRCGIIGHNTEDINAKIYMLKEDGSIVSVTVPASYCYDCNQYTILKRDLDWITLNGILLCQLENTIINKDTSKFAGDWNAESLLRKSGYNVNQQENLSERQRRIILAHVIDSGLMTKSQIRNHLEAMITLRRNMPNMRLAISKWNSDSNFVKNYNKGDVKTVAVRFTETRRIP